MARHARRRPVMTSSGPSSKSSRSQRETPRLKALRQSFTEAVVPKLAAVAKKLKFIDESGIPLGLTRLFGRAAPGQRVVEATPGYAGAHYTTIAALGLEGVSAPWVFEGAMNTATFEAYVEFVLCPTLRPGEIVILDNLSAHKSARVRQLVEARGARLEFLPPYSSDFNPIELCWAKVKTALRAAKARTFEALVEALAQALRAVTPRDAQAWFAHCGYEAP
ncbi:MAG: IS630 family transposase [Anaerolineales bacterium]|nr:IS630 family transposase [Anaerolineales bacterium]